MKYCHYTEQEVVDKTKEAIHYFISKQIDQFVKMLDRDFVWVGDYEPLYMKGIPAFLESVKEEIQEQLPISITEEEYALLSHERHLWITYGRFTVTVERQVSRIHFTFVWRQKCDNLMLLHANANHARPLPQVDAQSRIFELPSRSHHPLHITDEKKLAFRSLTGSIHYLQAEEIRYIKANNNMCQIFTTSSSFSCRTTLKKLTASPFLRIHKSYLVNASHLREICRYRATLLDGTELPIGKEWYMDLKQWMMKK
ncbi:MAG: LytTR family transcriptional regulator DNA-binding domain-containing protein [Enterocloster asparagiformis]|nr:LytTR family transcriptional regulator DNA-binding domain-containing protein [Enterocloster asparagiformis]